MGNRKRAQPHSRAAAQCALVVFLLCACAAVRLLPAQVPNDALILRGLDFERQNRNEEAAAVFRQVLAREPANAQAMLGVERVYTALGKRDSIMAITGRALQADRLNNTAW